MQGVALSFLPTQKLRLQMRFWMVLTSWRSHCKHQLIKCSCLTRILASLPLLLRLLNGQLEDLRSKHLSVSMTKSSAPTTGSSQRSTQPWSRNSIESSKLCKGLRFSTGNFLWCLLNRRLSWSRACGQLTLANLNWWDCRSRYRITTGTTRQEESTWSKNSSKCWIIMDWLM